MLKRVKRRYLALQLDGDCALQEREFLDAVWHSVTQLYGEYGASFAGLALIHYDADSKTAVLRVSLESLVSVRAALALITHVGGHEVAVHVAGVSGTLKGLRGQ